MNLLILDFGWLENFAQMHFKWTQHHGHLGTGEKIGRWVNISCDLFSVGFRFKKVNATFVRAAE